MLMPFCWFNLLTPVATASSAFAAVPADSRQLLVVTVERGINGKLLAYQRKTSDSAWELQQFTPLKVVVGKAGVAEVAEKVEGDNKTPAGLFPLGVAFGYYPLAVQMDYRLITSADKFIDDPQSPDYNQWVVGVTLAKSYENMRLSADSYKLGLVINYNMNPVVKGKGSAIFIHIWTAADVGTAGCVAMSEANLRRLLKWLAKEQQPYILIR